MPASDVALTTKGHQLVLAIVVLASLASFAALPPMVPDMATAPSARRIHLLGDSLSKNKKKDVACVDPPTRVLKA